MAGSDSSAGAGVQADLKTFAAHGVYGVSAITAIVAEAPGSVRSIQALPVETVSAQVTSCLAAFPVSAIKIGMLANERICDVADVLLGENPEIPSVIDPVLRASAGPALLDERGLDFLRSKLLHRASILTPNLPEAEILLGRSIPPQGLSDAARELHETFGCDILLKAGHLPSPSEKLVDHACLAGESVEFPHPRLAVGDVHGTGCTLSSAIAARLALGEAPAEALAEAIRYLARALELHWHWPHPRPTEALNHFPDGVESTRP